MWQPKGAPSTIQDCPAAGSNYCTTYGTKSSNYSVAAYNLDKGPRLADDPDTSMYSGPVAPSCGSAPQPKSIYEAATGYQTTKGQYSCTTSNDGFFDGLSLDFVGYGGEKERLELDGEVLASWYPNLALDEKITLLGETFTPDELPLPPRTPVQSELSMAGTGRLRRAPYGFVYQGFVELSGKMNAQKFGVRASCVNHRAPRDLCDPGLLIFQYSANNQFEKVYFDGNRDAGDFEPTGVYRWTFENNVHRGAPQNAQNAELIITLPPTSPTKKFFVIPYSAGRGTSRISLNFSTCDFANCALPWTRFAQIDEVFGGGENPSSRDLVVGGTMVDLGYVSDETFEAANQDNIGELNIKRFIFNVDKNKIASTSPFTPAVAGPYTFDETWEGTPTEKSHTYALVGELLPGYGKQAEKYTDLLLSPQLGDSNLTMTFAEPCSVPLGGARMSCPEIGEHLLPGGNYQFEVTADVFQAHVGSRVLGDHVAVGTRAFDCLENDPYFNAKRGQGNDLAFRMILSVDGVDVAWRSVPRGLLGSRFPGDNKVTLSYLQPIDGVNHRFKMRFESVGHAITIQDRLAYRRNPETVVFTAATQNLEYQIDVEDDGRYQTVRGLSNNARLLGGGPDFYNIPITLDQITPPTIELAYQFSPGLFTDGNFLAPNDREVRFRKNRGPYHADADFIVYQEMRANTGWRIQYHLNEVTPDYWHLAAMISAKSEYTDAVREDRYSPILVRPSVMNPNGGLMMPGSGGTLHDHTTGIDIRGAAWGPWAIDYATKSYSIAALAIPGNGIGPSQRAIVVYPLYLPSDNEDMPMRFHGIDAISQRAMRDLELEPGRFNHYGANDPLNENNRMIILGDSNMYNENCSEVNAALELLREKWGYAIDASMAAVDNSGRTFDGHYNGEALNHRHPDGSFRTGSYGADGHPFYWLGRKGWELLPESSRFNVGRFEPPESLVPFFPWWGQTSTLNGASEARLDVVLLVGRGWADDDPVVSYTIPSIHGHPNYMNKFVRGAGVDVRQNCTGTLDRIGGADATRTSAEGIVEGIAYKPDFDDLWICETGTQYQVASADTELNGTGGHTVESDHAPIIVKLRTRMRR